MESVMSLSDQEKLESLEIHDYSPGTIEAFVNRVAGFARQIDQVTVPVNAQTD